jgi:hypothetical protein
VTADVAEHHRGRPWGGACLAAEADSTIKQSTEADLWFEFDHLHLFDPESGRSL